MRDADGGAAVGPGGESPKTVFDLIPERFASQFEELAVACTGKPEFERRLRELLEEARAEVESAASVSLERFVVACHDALLRLVRRVNGEAARRVPTPESSVRVRVRSGDGTREWGLGSWVGNARIYAVVEEGPGGPVLRSTRDPEQMPTLGEFPAGTKVRVFDDNPKIVLDEPLPDGRRVVYGAQCWWEELPPGAESGEAVSESEFSELLGG